MNSKEEKYIEKIEVKRQNKRYQHAKRYLPKAVRRNNKKINWNLNNWKEDLWIRKINKRLVAYLYLPKAVRRHSGRINYRDRNDNLINPFTMKNGCGYVRFISIKRTRLIFHSNFVSKNKTRRRYVTTKRYFSKTTRTRKQKLQDF